MQHETLERIHFSNGKLTVPDDYASFLNLRETQDAIEAIKESFQTRLARELNLTRVSAPLVVSSTTGVNDHLNGVEQPVAFAVADVTEPVEVVQSLAKWKRVALADYGFREGEGLYTDMNALRPDEHLDNLHSIYVDQWDWERVISDEDRTVNFLREIVGKIYHGIREIEAEICQRYPQLPEPGLPENITFIHSEALRERYPEYTPQQREHLICEEKGAVFIIGIGDELEDGEPHDLRAADYDDWTSENEAGYRGLNGDILIWNPILKGAFELSSMGIRVDREALVRQLAIRGEPEKLHLPFHQRIVADELPPTIGGGIGQSRLCMFLLRKAHIGEVQSTIWLDEMKKACEAHNIFLL